LLSSLRDSLCNILARLVLVSYDTSPFPRHDTVDSNPTATHAIATLTTVARSAADLNTSAAVP
ncbi:hypothetical protein BGZ82_002508, partial [Podila clonocystis]